MKGCGKQLGDKDFLFYCGKECDICNECHIHYCKDCGINYENADNHGFPPFKESKKEVKK